MSTNPGTTDQPSPTAALVTGATGGIGRAICLALAALARQQGRPLRIAAAASRPGVALDALLAELTASAPRPTSPRPSATSQTPPTSPARAWWSTAAWRTTC